jgi:hypothetical protein
MLVYQRVCAASANYVISTGAEGAGTSISDMNLHVEIRSRTSLLKSARAKAAKHCRE